MKQKILYFFILICAASLYGTSQKKPRKKSFLDKSVELPVPTKLAKQPRTYDFLAAGVPFTACQMDQHVKLYEGYFKKRILIEDKLKTVDRADVANVTYSPFRALKVSEVFARNATYLHEQYFENLATGKKIGPKTKAVLIKNFGSIDAFKKDLLDTASCARGWVITGYCLRGGDVANYLVDAHHVNIPWLIAPLIVVDVYEHAYMIDFGIDRAKYLKDTWDSINWDVVEKRVVTLLDSGLGDTIKL
jgi:Fe-Mn family superoxide dismutase